MILPWFRRSSQTNTIAALYGAIVAQARSVSFYADYGVPDTVEGRFDLLVLHLVLLLYRLSHSSGAARELGQKLGQELFDAFCRDLDAQPCGKSGTGDLARADARCKRLPGRFMAGRPLTSPRSKASTPGPLRRRSNAISLRGATMPERPSLLPMGGWCCPGSMPWTTMRF